MAELLTRPARANWGGLQGGSGDGSRIRDDFTVLPPEARWDRSIRCERRQGDVAPWASNVSVAQVQASNHHSPGQSRWISLWTRIDQLATYSGLDFHMLHEVHSQGAGTSAPWAENVTTGPLQRQLRRTPTGFNHVWPAAARTPLVLGAWYWAAFGCSHTTGTGGFFEMLLNGNDPIYSQTGIRTSDDGTAWYPKIGGYTWASTPGTDVFYIAGWSLHDSRPTFPGSAPPVDTPSVSIIVPTAGQILVGTLPYEVDVENAPPGSTLYTGLGALGVFDADSALSGDSTQTGALNLAGAPAGGREDGFYTALHDASGTQLATDGFIVSVFPEEEDPPPVEDIAIGFDSVGDDASTFALEYADPDEVTIGADDVIARIPTGSYDPDSRDAVALLLARGFSVTPPFHFFHKVTGERLEKRPNGTFTPYSGS